MIPDVPCPRCGSTDIGTWVGTDMRYSPTCAKCDYSIDQTAGTREAAFALWREMAPKWVDYLEFDDEQGRAIDSTEWINTDSQEPPHDGTDFWLTDCNLIVRYRWEVSRAFPIPVHGEPGGELFNWSHWAPL